MLVDAMVDRAQAGVEVRVVLDAIGSSLAARTARRGGCATPAASVSFYQPMTWYRLHRLNNRTHRELLVVDGRVAFTGGAGVADWWLQADARRPTWRDTMARIEGPIVAALQGVFAENWLECCGEILTSPRHWPALEPAGPAEAMLVKSSPSDRATVVARRVSDADRGRGDVDRHQHAVLPAGPRAAAGAGARRAARRAGARRSCPGRVTDQRLVRLASRRMYRELLDGGVRIFEYRPAMTHVKALMVDGAWAMIGTTNIDNRSFEHNDEVNVAFREPACTARLRRDFEADLAASDEITLERWRGAPAVREARRPGLLDPRTSAVAIAKPGSMRLAARTWHSRC